MKNISKENLAIVCGGSNRTCMIMGAIAFAVSPFAIGATATIGAAAAMHGCFN